MGKITLSSGFKPVSEGEHTFKVLEGSTYDEKWGKVTLKLENEKGEKHTEFYNLLDANGEVDTKAIASFSYTARCIMNDQQLGEVEVNDLVGKSFIATVVHTTSATTGKVFANLKDKKPAVETNDDSEDITNLFGD